MKPTQRLLLLADRLEEDANNPEGLTFSLHEWIVRPMVKRPIELDIDPEYLPPTVKCDTAGCGMGLAMLQPEFQAEGLEMRFYGRIAYPFYKGYEEFEAAEWFFGLSPETARHLFSPGAYPQTRGKEAELAVASRIRDYVEALDLA